MQTLKTDMYSVLQIIDRLCASMHYRQAVSCENSGASMAASPSQDCLLRITMSHHKVVHLPASPQQAAASAAAGQSPSPSPSQITSMSSVMIYNNSNMAARTIVVVKIGSSCGSGSDDQAEVAVLLMVMIAL